MAAVILSVATRKTIMPAPPRSRQLQEKNRQVKVHHQAPPMPMMRVGLRAAPRGRAASPWIAPHRPLLNILNECLQIVSQRVLVRIWCMSTLLYQSNRWSHRLPRYGEKIKLNLHFFVYSLVGLCLLLYIHF